MRSAVLMCGVGVTLLAAVEAILLHDNPVVAEWALLLFPELAMAYAVAGMVMWIRRPHNGMGAASMWGALAWLAAGLVNVVDVPWLVAVGLVVSTVPYVPLIYLLLAFPSGKLRRRLDRWIVVAGAFVAVVMQIPLYVFMPDGSPYDVLQVTPRPELINDFVNLQRLVGGLVVTAVAVTLAVRLREASPTQRAVLGPVYVLGIAAVLAIPSHAIVADLFGLSAFQTTVIALIAMGVVPLAFAVCLYRGGFSRTTEVEELGAWLGAVQGERPEIRNALADTLGDPTLELVFASTSGGYIDAAGRVVEVGEDDHRAKVDIELEGRRLGAVVYDPTMIRDRELVAEAGRVVALALHRDQLHANLRASEEAVRRSRRRIVEAGDQERRRLAQDLHDGLQAKLVLLAIDAGRGGDVVLRLGIEQSIADLRALVHGVMPPLLVELGLYAATEDLIDRVPLSTRLELPDDRTRLDPLVEHAAYLVVSEAVTNVLKHAQATHLDVCLRSGGRSLTIDVDDDGVGGASASGGAGLRGIADRIDTLGGRLLVTSSAAGTRVSAEVPCFA